MPTGAARFMQPLDVTPLGHLRSMSTDPLPEARWRFHSLSLRDLPFGAVAPASSPRKPARVRCLRDVPPHPVEAMNRGAGHFAKGSNALRNTQGRFAPARA